MAFVHVLFPIKSEADSVTSHQKFPAIRVHPKKGKTEISPAEAWARFVAAQTFTSARWEAVDENAVKSLRLLVGKVQLDQGGLLVRPGDVVLLGLI